MIDKGTLQAEDAYSGFQGTDLARKLNESPREARSMSLGWRLTTASRTRCWTGRRKGFETYVITDCVKGVNLKRTDSATALRTMLSRGARQTTSGRLLKSLVLRPTISAIPS